MMSNPTTHLINLQYTVVTEQCDDGKWSARMIDVLGVTVYGDTEQEAIDRTHDAVQFFVDHFSISSEDGMQRLRQYFDEHGVPHTISRVPSDVAWSDSISPRRNRPQRRQQSATVQVRA